MASVSSSTSSLGSTIRGYGGMASGIDRDSIIEQLLQGMDTKISNVNKKITKTEWKQEAYQSLSDKIIALQDDYFGYAANTSLTSSSTFAKSKVSVIGNSDVTQYVSATGTSSMIDYLSIVGVSKLASSAVRQSEGKETGAITTNIKSLTEPTGAKESKLKGLTLSIGTNDSNGKYTISQSFVFPTEYTYTETTKDDEGNEKTETKTKTIDYVGSTPEELVDQLNAALKEAKFGNGLDGCKGYLQFKLENNELSMYTVDKDGKETNNTLGNYRLKGNALEGLGYSGTVDTGISIDAFNSASKTEFKDSASYDVTYGGYLSGKSLDFTYGAQTKSISLSKDGIDDIKLSNDETNYIQANNLDETMYKYTKLLQSRVDKAFGSGKIEVSLSLDVANKGALSFNTKDSSDTLTINSSDSTLRSNLGITSNASNKISTEGKIIDNWNKLGFGLEGENVNINDSEAVKSALDEKLKNFTINGVKIDGLNSNMTISEMMDKINDTEDAGVKASYLSGTNQFILVATESGSGRKIELGGSADTIFGCKEKNEAEYNKDGEDAVIEVSYGNGITTTIKSSSNTFDLEGLKVTVNSTFGYKTDENGEWITKKDENEKDVLVADTSQAISFSAKADVDGVTETVKKFFESYNELIKEINTQLTTKPNDYEPLTDEEKDALDDTTVEKWEKKAKEGLLYGDSTLRSLSMDMQSILTQFMTKNGLGSEELEAIGISFSDDYLDGGTIVFDEDKFKEAMESDPDSVADVFCGGGSSPTSLTSIMESTLTKYATRYATRNGNSYGMLIEEAGSSKVPTSLTNNQIYRDLKDLQEQLERLKDQRQSKEDRYITTFTAMESAISNMNTQSSYLSSLSS